MFFTTIEINQRQDVLFDYRSLPWMWCPAGSIDSNQFCALVTSPWAMVHISSQPLFRRHIAGWKLNIEGAHWLWDGQSYLPWKYRILLLHSRECERRDTYQNENQMCPYRMPPWEGQCDPLGYTVELYGHPFPTPFCLQWSSPPTPPTFVFLSILLVRNTNQHAFPEHLMSLFLCLALSGMKRCLRLCL